MKLIFSLFMLVTSFHTQASKVFIYHERDSLNEAKAIKKIFLTKYHIPENLIKVQIQDGCHRFEERFLELCVNKKGELKVLSLSSYEKAKTLKIFSKGL